MDTIFKEVDKEDDKSGVERTTETHSWHQSSSTAHTQSQSSQTVTLSQSTARMVKITTSVIRHTSSPDRTLAFYFKNKT
jgi:hypothetical protein